MDVNNAKPLTETEKKTFNLQFRIYIHHKTSLLNRNCSRNLLKNMEINFA